MTGGTAVAGSWRSCGRIRCLYFPVLQGVFALFIRVRWGPRRGSIHHDVLMIVDKIDDMKTSTNSQPGKTIGTREYVSHVDRINIVLSRKRHNIICFPNNCRTWTMDQSESSEYGYGLGEYAVTTGGHDPNEDSYGEIDFVGDAEVTPLVDDEPSSSHFNDQYSHPKENDVDLLHQEYGVVDTDDPLMKDHPSADNESEPYMETATTNTSSIPDIMTLNFLCAQAKAPKETAESEMEAAESWQAVREWLSNHDADTVKLAAEQRGESGLTALHFACRNNPPIDVIDVLLSIAAETVRWTDSFGWLPVHYACASGSETSVIYALTESFPESKTATDRRKRTPLHFALGERAASPDIISVLSSSGAAQVPDEIGMLPLHYACAFGASEEVLYVLAEAYPDAITARDSRQRTPLHFALSNAEQKSIPAAVRLLLSLNKSIVNSIDGGPLPLRVLAEYSHAIRKTDGNKDEKRESVLKCLEHLLHADPKSTADFFTALQSLPDWLQEHAVVMPVVQNLLNKKISERFPTAVLMLDFLIRKLLAHIDLPDM